MINLLRPLQYPTPGMGGKPEVRVVGVSGRGRHENQLAARPHLRLSHDLQLGTNPSALIIRIHRQIGEITGIVKIGQGTGDTHQSDQ
jgi:hypothetical protein